jgi:hypothetical protein
MMTACKKISCILLAGILLAPSLGLAAPTENDHGSHNPNQVTETPGSDEEDSPLLKELALRCEETTLQNEDYDGGIDGRDPTYGFVPAECFCDPRKCGFDDAIEVFSRLVKFFVIWIIPLFAAIAFVYAGFTLLTANGNTGAYKKSREIFTFTALGIVLFFAAYLIVNVIIKTLEVPTAPPGSDDPNFNQFQVGEDIDGV